MFAHHTSKWAAMPWSQDICQNILEKCDYASLCTLALTCAVFKESIQQVFTRQKIHLVDFLQKVDICLHKFKSWEKKQEFIISNTVQDIFLKTVIYSADLAKNFPALRSLAINALSDIEKNCLQKVKKKLQRELCNPFLKDIFASAKEKVNGQLMPSTMSAKVSLSANQQSCAFLHMHVMSRKFNLDGMLVAIPVSVVHGNKQNDTLHFNYEHYKCYVKCVQDEGGLFEECIVENLRSAQNERYGKDTEDSSAFQSAVIDRALQDYLASIKK